MTAAASSQFLKAVASGNIDKVDNLLTAAASKSNILALVTAANKKGQTAIIVAVCENYLTIAQRLLRHLEEGDDDGSKGGGGGCLGEGVVLDQQDKDYGYTALMFCIALKLPRSIEMVEVLLSGYDKNDTKQIEKSLLSIRDKDGMCAIHLAAKFDFPDALDKLLTLLNGQDIVPYLEKTLDAKGRNALQLAAAHGNLDCLKMLIERATTKEINLQDAQGNTALHWAIRSEADVLDEMISILLNKGANLGLCNQAGDSVLHFDAIHCDPNQSWPSKIANLLLKADSTLAEKKNKSGETAQDLFNDDMDENDLDEKAMETTESDEITLIKNNRANAAAAIAARGRSKKSSTNSDLEIQSGTKSSILTMLCIISISVALIAMLYGFLSNLQNKN